jgi:hypothetical protein
MAALEVVHGRLEQLGLGAICLELHSHKANKKSVLEELARTLALGRPKKQGSEEQLERLQAAIGRLNRHSELMNTRVAQSGPTPFQIIGRLTCLYSRGVEATNLGLIGLESWTMGQFRERCQDVEDLQVHLNAIGPPSDHSWCGVNRAEPILHAELNEFLAKLDDAVRSLRQITGAGEELANLLGLAQDIDFRIKDAQQLAQFAIRLVNAPSTDLTHIVDPVWEERAPEIARLVEKGRGLAVTRYREQYRLLEDFRQCHARVSPASEHPCRGVKRASPLTVDESRRVSGLLHETIDPLLAVLDVAGGLEQSLRIEPRPDASLRDIQQLAQLAIRVLNRTYP